MLAMPVATISLCVLASSQEECTSALRPRLSGIHSAAYPQSSTRFANAAAAGAVMLSIEIQTPSLPNSIDSHSCAGTNPSSVNLVTGFVQPAFNQHCLRDQDSRRPFTGQIQLSSFGKPL